jgi:hypothetical protein
VRRYFELAGTILAGTIFAPIALWVISIVVLVALLFGL